MNKLQSIIFSEKSILCW